LLDDYAPFPWNRMSDAYAPWTNYAPALWRGAYRFLASRRRVARLERAMHPYVRGRVAEPLLANAGDLVIAVHPLQTAIPLRILREAGRRTPFLTVVTDPVSPPAVWFCPDVDCCVVATAPARQAALDAGMPGQKVRVAGLPVRRSFVAAGRSSKAEARRALGLDPSVALALISGGGAGIGNLLPLTRALTAEIHRAGARAQTVVLAGRNEALRRRLDAEEWDASVRVLGFAPDPACWLAAADLLLTKAGPSTLGEAACTGLPVIITGFVPGQEAGNVTWVTSHGAGVYAPDPHEAAALAVRWLQGDPAELAALAASARALAQPDAAEAIVQVALGMLERA
jgi:1,2-diacylglycerol 3-beta-galactosyltransferase